MARSVWTGTISFGLVNVPVKAYTAVRDHEVHFHQLEKGTGARIRYEKVSDKTGKEVESDDIELGYEIRKGRYVTFDREELDDLRPESTRAIEVSDFVALDAIDPVYYERTYWLGPDGDAATTAYQLLLAAMEERQRVGVGTVVMRNKQYLAAVRPLDGALAMSTMRFADEVVPKADVDEVPSRRSKPDAKALKLALQIIDSLETDWEPERYRDTYTDELLDIVRRKDKGQDVVVEAAAEPEGKVLDLMAALEASLAEHKSGKRRPPKKSAAKKPAAKKPPAKKSAAKKSAAKRRTSA